MKSNLLLCLVTVFVLIPGYALGKLPAGFKEKVVVKGLTSPVTFDFAPDGRIFVCEQTGEVRVFKNGALLPQLFLKLDSDTQGEHGVLGITFDPQFSVNHFVYIYYTSKTPYLHNRLSRFVADGDVAKTDSEQVLLDLDDIQTSIYHSAGAIDFGPDGKLYVGVGENGGVPYVRNAQLLTNPFGKVLRINSDGSIPEDNPFFQTATGIYRSIWALGLRNPFTLAFEPTTNKMYINDVGASDWEEINEGGAGFNYGWPDVTGNANDPRYKQPIFSYAHGPVTSEVEGCAVTGGTFYNPEKKLFPPQYLGKYFFVDYCNNWMKTLNPVDKTVEIFGKEISANPISLKTGPDGGLYYISRWLRGIYQITYQAPAQKGSK